MNARVLMLVFSLVSLISDFAQVWIYKNHDKKPLPVEVNDIYDEERYKTYLNYKSECRKHALKGSVVTFVIEMVFILSDFYSWIEQMCGNNVYYIFIITTILVHLIHWVDSYISEYYSTFKIEEKYGLNKYTVSSFTKDFVIQEFTDLFSNVVFYLILIFICEHLSVWTNNFNISYGLALLLVVSITIVLILISILLSGFELLMIFKSYTFTPLLEGELKDTINHLQEGCKKKVKHIYVYDESKKTTSKNAFLAKLPFYRIFGIADNFINENANEELYAVFSHEIGHLKHKKDFIDYLKYFFDIILILFLAYVISNPSLVFDILHWISESFDLNYNNYVLNLLVFGAISSPFNSVSSLYSDYVSRRNEYEADREAVKNGYGEELITMFKTMAKDELENVYPPLFDEILSDHPSIYRRIKAIREYK